MTEGSAKAELAFPTLLQAYTEDPLSVTFAFVRLQTSYTPPGGGGTIQATFWVTSDAIKWKIPSTPKWAVLLSEWNKSKEADPGDNDGDMLCRLPGSATHNQEIADVITTHPNAHATGASSGLVHSTAQVTTGMAPAASLLLTPLLYDVRWASAKTAGTDISPCNQDIDKPIVGESAKLNKCVNQKIKAAMSKAGTTNNLPNIVGDPGKIWAITNDIGADKVQQGKKKDGKPYTYRYKAAVNYGWHGTNLQSKAVTQGQTVIQSVGTRHDKDHLDYSQVAVLVAGWCEITRPGGQATFTRTDQVYGSQELCGLVAHDGNPLRVIRY